MLKRNIVKSCDHKDCDRTSELVEIISITIFRTKPYKSLGTIHTCKFHEKEFIKNLNNWKGKSTNGK